MTVSKRQLNLPSPQSTRLPYLSRLADFDQSVLPSQGLIYAKGKGSLDQGEGLGRGARPQHPHTDDNEVAGRQG